PANVVAVNLLGGLYFQVNKLTEALNAYQKAITISPEWSSPYRSVALINQMQNRKAEAIKALGTGIDHAQDTMELVADLAAIYHEDGEHEKVLALYEQAYRQNPDSLTAINHLANYLSDYAKDGKALERAAKLAEPLANTGDPYMLDTVGWLAYKQGDYEKAEKILLKALALNPAAPVSDYHLGMVYFKKGDSSHAREYLEKAISKKTDFNGLTEAEATLKSINAKG
ncbi:MAG: tetratricopeptide repeat protein, partial [Methylococcaceae bacterium]